VVIADYGSSQGKNSCVPVQVAINALRSRLGAARPILVHHIDLPANDFNALFEVLASDTDRYAADDPNVFPCAIGRSFYANVLPPGQVDLGWSSYAAMWLSRVPGLIPGHFCVTGSCGAVRAEFERQAARDWKTFLALRSLELRFGGRLVVVVPGANEEGFAGFEKIMDQANSALAAMTEEYTITADERNAMVLGALPRTKQDLLAPFVDGHFRGLVVEQCEIAELEDPAWEDFQRSGDPIALARGQAAFFRTTFAPTLARSLSTPRQDERVTGFSERLEEQLRQRLQREPTPVRSFVGTVVLAKQ
jgi:hypothetical protein